MNKSFIFTIFLLLIPDFTRSMLTSPKKSTFSDKNGDMKAPTSQIIVNSRIGPGGGSHLLLGSSLPKPNFSYQKAVRLDGNHPNTAIREFPDLGPPQSSELTHSLDLDLYRQADGRFQKAPARSFMTVLVSDLVFLALSLFGVYLSLFGFRIFGYLMVLLGFFVTYYSALLLLSFFQVPNLDGPLVQLGLFWGGLFLGVGITFACYMLTPVLYIVFGMSCGVMASATLAQFAVELQIADKNIIIFSAWFLISLGVALATFLFFEQCLIIVSAFVGGTQTSINLGFLLRDSRPFYLRTDTRGIPFDLFFPYAVGFLVIFLMGLFTQYYLRQRIINRMRFSTAAKPPMRFTSVNRQPVNKTSVREMIRNATRVRDSSFGMDLFS